MSVTVIVIETDVAVGAVVVVVVDDAIDVNNGVTVVCG